MLYLVIKDSKSSIDYKKIKYSLLEAEINTFKLLKMLKSNSELEEKEMFQVFKYTKSHLIKKISSL